MKSDSERARKLVRQIIRAAKRAEALAQRGKDFSDHAAAVRQSIAELAALQLLPKPRKEFAEILEAQGKPMTSAMMLGGYLCNAARAVRAGPTPANTPTLPAPAPMPA